MNFQIIHFNVQKKNFSKAKYQERINGIYKLKDEICI